jgi:hypothetical protein
MTANRGCQEHLMTRPETDGAAIASLERKLHVVRDHVRAVADGFKTGLYLYGAGGVGKSFTVLRHLESLDAPFQLYNSRMTAKGLFMAMSGMPDAIHVMEDLERLTRDKDAQSILRAALWAQPGHDRAVTCYRRSATLCLSRRVDSHE